MTKKVAVALAMAGIAASATATLAGTKAGSGINGSKHDINAVGGYTGDTLNRTCVFCHTPHNAYQTRVPGGKGSGDALTPLWNHADNQTSFIANAYAWVAPTNKTIEFATDPLVGPSRLCMACHDGDTAVDSHGTAGSSIGTRTMKANLTTGSSYQDALGHTATRYITDLTVTHPIGFNYDAARNIRGSRELVPSSFGFLMSAPYGADAAGWDTQARYDSTGNNPVDASALTTKKISDTLYGGYMTCATCHDVHNSVNVSDANYSYNYFLYAREEGSAICLSCHIK